MTDIWRFLPRWLPSSPPLGLLPSLLLGLLLLCLLLLWLPGTALAQFPGGGTGSGAGAEADTTALPIEYNADRIEYLFGDDTWVMTGSAEVKYGDVELTAGRLRFQTHTELLTADFLPPAPDINPATNTYPRLSDETNVVVGDRMQYDMNTGEGQIWKGRTRYQEGFFNGELITLNADRTFEIHQGTYTTCDNPNHLHYYLRMGEAKVVPDDKAVVRNVTGYIMGIPVIYLPVYVFSVKSGRQSGFTVPNYGSGVEEGRYLRNLGYYWAPNEYFDMKSTVDIEAKTGFMLRKRFQYRQDRRIRGSASGSWRTGFDGKTSGWDVSARHRQEVIPGLTVRGQGNFAQSLQYLHSTTRGTDPGLLRSSTRSSFAIDKKFGRNSLNLSTSTSGTTGRPSRPTTTLRFRFGTTAIFKPPRRQTRRGSMPDFSRPRTEIEERWFHTIMFGFNNTLRNRRKNVRLDRDTTYTGPDIRYNYRHDSVRTFSNAFNLSAPQKLMGWLKIRPQVQYTRAWEQDTGPETEGKWETNEDHTVGMSVNTTLYGLFQPKIGRLNAIRHVVTPDINFSQSGGARVRKRARFSLNNILQARTEHEGREKKYNLVYVKSSTSYDFQAEDRKLADLRTSVRIPSRRLSVNLTMNHDFYDPETNEFRRPWLDRLTLSASLNLVGPRRDQFGNEIGDSPFGGAFGGYDDFSGGGFSGGGFSGFSGGGFDSFSGGGFGGFSGGGFGGFSGGGFGDDYGGYGGYGDDRFNQRFAQVKGPWTVRLSHRYSIQRSNPNAEEGFTTSTHVISATNRFSLNDITDPLRLTNRVTDKWRVQHSINYDYRRKKIVAHSIDLYRPLHCWEFTFRWVPNGLNKGFYFRINLMAHPDVKFEQQRRSGGDG